MSIADKEPIVLPNVPLLEGINLDNPLEVNLLTVHQETAQTKNIKQLRLTEITDKINHLKRLVGTTATENNDATGLFLGIDTVNGRVDGINETIGVPKANSAEGVGSGLYGLIEDLQADRDIIKNKSIAEGYKIHFISPKDKSKVNLLAGDSNSKYNYTFSSIKENITTCITNHQSYDVRMHLGLTYTLKNSTLGELSTNVTINLNAAYASKDKKAVVYIPVANAIIGLKFTIEDKKISFVVSDKIGTDNIKSDELWVQHGVLEFNKLDSIIATSSN